MLKDIKLAKMDTVTSLSYCLACQIIVNIALNMDRGGRFYWQTPGVLTLLAIASSV